MVQTRLHRIDGGHLSFANQILSDILKLFCIWTTFNDSNTSGIWIPLYFNFFVSLSPNMLNRVKSRFTYALKTGAQVILFLTQKSIFNYNVDPSEFLSSI